MKVFSLLQKYILNVLEKVVKSEWLSKEKKIIKITVWHLICPFLWYYFKSLNIMFYSLSVVCFSICFCIKTIDSFLKKKKEKKVEMKL